jgi:delta 1-pyrroline-5-carboxylate dehydrogenase
MSDQMDQESIQQSFPTGSIPDSFNDNRKEENVTSSPSSINSILNNNNVPSVSNIPSTNDETNSSTPVTKKGRPRRTRINSSSAGRPIRNKIVKESSIKNEPYTIPYSTRSQTQQLRQQAASLVETISSSTTIVDSNVTNVTNATQSTTNSSITVNPQAPITERKKHCAKCKESASVAKIINSKMDRIEELVRNLKKVTDEIGQNNILSQSSSSINTNNSFSSFRGINFSRMSIVDLQNFVMVVTNTIMTTASHNTTEIKSEFEEGAQFLKIETSQ